jgi:hypothetical protein
MVDQINLMINSMISLLSFHTVYTETTAETIYAGFLLVDVR